MQTVPLGAGGAIPRPLSYARGRRGLRIVVLALATGLLPVGAAPAGAEPASALRIRLGQASWYGREFARRRTASGERFDPHGLTGAHRTLPFGSRVLVTNLRNGRSVTVTITDRGPYRKRREIDLSLGAARALGMVERGIAPVRIELLES